MIQLPLGLLTFALPHLWKRLWPGSRARLGDPGKGIVAVLSVAGIWLAARGYGAWDDAPVAWAPGPWARHVNNLLVVVGFYFFIASGMGVWGARVTRHPQLTGVILWAVAHLLANGDWASILLFGGFLVWAVGEIVLINRAAPLWVPPPRAPVGKEVTAVALTLVAVAVVGYIHGWIGPWPFG
ncbi:NnrU family protein [Rubellimicrobium aerolatum]|uniref:NnrU family protein n=1 Tax=Rubellimicrobium aerolatum TaxID=490979 RepID=A0ABW0SAU4_9RHOB|nr:NnrU family protein [Rubellimicrobium aerolatum]MBP1805334.1 putative membrane protein [Rubellimicrobium aerolatum]